MFGPVIVIAEGKTGRAALAQSWAYVYGKSWKVFGRLLLLELGYLVVISALQLLGATFKGTPLPIVTAIISIVLQIAFYFYAFAFHYTLYTQLKNSSIQTDGQKGMKVTTRWLIWGVVVIPLIILIAVLLSLYK